MRAAEERRRRDAEYLYEQQPSPEQPYPEADQPEEPAQP